MKVSFVTGIYNAEKYLDECICSMLNQSYKDFEIILIVNGSKDRSAEIADYYQMRNACVKAYFYEEKLGAGGSRGVGLLKSSGDYIAFVDNDDVLEENYLEEMLSVVMNKESRPDIVFCDYCKVNERNGKILYKRRLGNAERALAQSVAPWGKLYRRNFLIENDLIPRNIPFGEDVLFTADVILSAPVIHYCDFIGYRWRDNENSTSHKELSGFPENTLVLSTLYFSDIYRKHYVGNEERCSYLIFKYYMWYLLNSGRNVKRSRIRKEYSEIIVFLNAIDPKWNVFSKQRLRMDGERGIVTIVLLFLRIFEKIGCLDDFLGFYGNSFLGYFWPSL